MSLFAKAKTIETKVPGRPKATKHEIAIAGIQQLAEIKAMMDSLAAVAKTIETDVKTAGFGEFLKMETKVKPDSFRGTDGMASASVEMRKRGTNSALNADEVEQLEGLGLTPHKEVITVEMFGINPEFAKDLKLMERVSKALEKIVPEDFIVHQAEASKLVVSDAVLDAAFALEHGSMERETALSICTTMALKPKLEDNYPMNELSARVAKYLAPESNVEELEAEGAKLVVEAAKPKAARKTKAIA